MIKIMKLGLDATREAAAHGDGSTWTVFDCGEINDLNPHNPFGGSNRRWSEAWLITFALRTEKDRSNVTSHAMLSLLL